jgi:hypothetical protein
VPPAKRELLQQVVRRQLFQSIKRQEETMKIRLLFTLAGLAIGFAAPVLAQEQNTVDPEVRQQIEAVAMKFNRRAQ